MLDSTDMVLVPKGTTAEKVTSPVNGHMRYNTTTNVFENYQAGSWAPIRRFEPANIVMQSLGNGNDVETKFGPLDNQDTYNPLQVRQILLFWLKTYFTFQQQTIH